MKELYKKDNKQLINGIILMIEKNMKQLTTKDLNNDFFFIKQN